MGVSKNRGTPKSSILIGFSIINHPFWGFYPYFWKHPDEHEIRWLIQLDLVVEPFSGQSNDGLEFCPDCQASVTLTNHPLRSVVWHLWKPLGFRWLTGHTLRIIPENGLAVWPEKWGFLAKNATKSYLSHPDCYMAWDSPESSAYNCIKYINKLDSRFFSGVLDISSAQLGGLAVNVRVIVISTAHPASTDSALPRHDDCTICKAV